ncbi:MAG TPA: hypothetical protein VH914_08620 [Acidimicrobiia bacterium]|jgi:hypothetical protein|nr:hypothetical protein [Acidimicrobiia bacterium]
MTPSDSTRPTGRTRETEREDAQTKAHADREPTPEEEKLAEKNQLDPEAAKNYEDMAERGANQKGEGRID